MEPSPFDPKPIFQLSFPNSGISVLKIPGEMSGDFTCRPLPGMQKGFLGTAKLPLMLWGTSLGTFVRVGLQRTEPTAPPLDELSRDPLAFVAHWVEYASTSSVGQTWIALLALALSSAAFAGQFFKGREADLSVRFAKTPDFKYMADRLIIVNHGAASAKNIKLVLTVELQAVAEKARDGVVHVPGQEAGKQQWKPWREMDPFPIPLLAPGASFHLPVRVIGNQLGEAPFAQAKLTWRDRRLLTQSWESTVSSTGATLGGPSLENFEAERQTKLRSLMP